MGDELIERVFQGCPLHPGMVEWIRDEREERKAVLHKLDQLIERQAFHHEEVLMVKSIVTNGLKTTIEQTAANVTSIGTKVDTVCGEVENFKWFTDWVNGMRNHIFKKLFMGAVIIVAILGAVHFGNQMTAKIVKWAVG